MNKKQKFELLKLRKLRFDRHINKTIEICRVEESWTCERCGLIVDTYYSTINACRSCQLSDIFETWQMLGKSKRKNIYNNYVRSRPAYQNFWAENENDNIAKVRENEKE